MKVVKISDKEKASITGGYGASSTVQCDGGRSAFLIIYGASQWTCN
ncbi:hypothetical protein [Flavobacterium aestivum]|nr:hypothetical protein [Flavobacterium aestivum]